MLDFKPIGTSLGGGIGASTGATYATVEAEALHGHAHSSRNFPTCGVINRKGLGINLQKKGEEKERRQMLRQEEKINKHAKERAS